MLGNVFKKNLNLFPPNDRIHIMQPREHEHYNVCFARTNRFKGSPVIFMLNILMKIIVAPLVCAYRKKTQKKKEQDQISLPWPGDLFF